MTASRNNAVALVLLLAACAAPDDGGPALPVFVIESQFGAESDWVAGHLAASAAVLVRLLDNPDVALPRRIDVTLEKDPEAGWLGGGSGPTALGFVSDQWPEEAQRLWILTHELVNLFVAHYGGHGGFPSDWWSNGRSPFPIYVTVLVLRELGHDAEADWLRGTCDDPDHELYWRLHEQHGFALFAGALRLLRADDVPIGEFDPPWPHPDRVRSAYMVAYLSMAAGEDLTATVNAFGVGREPGDWDTNHLDIPFEEYTLTAEEVDGIRRARAAVLGRPASAEARALYRAGRWREALAAVGEG